MYYLIYQITNKTNGKIYIGKHKTKNKDDDYMGSGKFIRYAIEQEGIENFEKTILFECQSEEEMNQKEREIVNEDFVKREDTYNVALGGDGGWFYCNGKHNNKHNWRRTGILQYMDKNINPFLEWKKTLTDEEIKIYCQNISDGLKHYIEENGPIWTGKHHSEETKKKMSEIHQKNHHQQGEKNSNYGKHWWKDPNDKTKSMSIKEGDPVPEGWVRGKWQNMSEQAIENIKNGCRKNIGKIIVTNGIKRIKISKDDEIPEGFYIPKNQKISKNTKKLEKIERSEAWKKEDHERRLKLAEDRRQKLALKMYLIIKEQYLFWLEHSWKEFCIKYDYKYSRTNFIQQCKRYLKEEWHPKNG